MVNLPFARSQRRATVPAETADGLDIAAAAHVGQPEELTLWQRLTTVRINPVNNKCTTLPILKLNNPYSINFHLSWLGFWVAFLSWFAFSPLIPEAVKTDLKLTQQQIGNSNIVSLCSTLLVRVIVGPLVDRYGPRKVMAGLLIVGAIPSGLAGTVSSAHGLYVIRFFIGILGGTFVPCQAWTTAFYDTAVVGRANALVAGWGNSGGGFTFIIMVALYDRLRSDGLSPHSAWRAAFAIVPVPILFFVALLTLLVGTDHPNGKWADRHKVPMALPHDGAADGSSRASGDIEVAERKVEAPTEKIEREKDPVNVEVASVMPSRPASVRQDSVPLTWKLAMDVVLNPLTWLPALAYMSSFGYELAIDANLANVYFGLYNKTKGFGQTRCGYIASIFGLLNVFTRPFGGYLGDAVYRWWGVPGKKYLVLALGLLQGAMSLAWGLYLDRHHASLGVVIWLMVLTATVDEIGNGANFALVPHCNPHSNGLMTGIVGALGNLGGVWFALVFRFQPAPFGKAFWISGIVVMITSVLLVVIRVPRK
ncbi:nitrate transporter [Phanerochaete sordida]|uniref:Nitrate/nitrite transporter n=1 Tax=Phanerochaete sordida TaxID=48140 RepID=A0A9P3FZU8_9APHY|nr:nitrate transporter [Phanerochaete sordida]